MCDAVLLDSGYSLAGAVSLKFFRRIQATNPSIVLQPTHIILKAANDSPMKVKGVFTGLISSFDKSATPLLTLDFLVVEDMPFPAVFGNQILKLSNQSAVDATNRGTLKLPSGGRLPFRVYENPVPAVNLLSSFTSDFPVTIPPRECFRLPCAISSNSKQKRVLHQATPLISAVVEAHPSLRSSFPSLSVTPSLCTLSMDSTSLVSVIVHNISSSPVVVPNSSLLAQASVCAIAEGKDRITALAWSPSLIQSFNLLVTTDERLLGSHGRPDEDCPPPGLDQVIAAIQEEESRAELLVEEKPEDEDERMAHPPVTSDEEIFKSLNSVPRPTHLSDEEWNKYKQEVLFPFVDIMRWGPRDPDQVAKVLPPHRIDLVEGAKPVHQQPYQKGPAARAEEARQVGEMLKDNITQPSHSSYASPTVLVRKPGGTWRFCVDYRKLNAQTVKDVYPLPRVDETLDLLRHANYITTVDLKSGFWQIPIHKEHRSLTAFAYSGGLHEYVFMPFGLCNAPATFQRTMDTVLSGMKWQFCFPYLDDIIIFSRTFEEHVKHVQAVFQRLREHSLSISLKKCQFAVNEVKFLGHIVKEGTLRPNPDKVRAVQEMTIPTNRKSLQSFLGLVNYYRQFIPHFSQIAAPLHRLAASPKSGIIKPFEWTAEHTEAFNTLRTLLSTAPVLLCPDFSRPFIVQTDASDVALGAVLSQTLINANGEEEEHPIAFLSRVLNEAERNYDTTQRECLAVVFAIKKWRHYLEGSTFKVVTDHIALKWLLNQKNAPNQRLARWILHLQEFNYSIEHRAGLKHQNADALSRCVDSEAILCSMIAACSPSYCAASGRSSLCSSNKNTKLILTMSTWKPDVKQMSLLQMKQLSDHSLLLPIALLNQYGRAEKIGGAQLGGGGDEVESKIDSSTSLPTLMSEPVTSKNLVGNDSIGASIDKTIVVLPDSFDSSSNSPPEFFKDTVSFVRRYKLALVDGTLSHRLAVPNAGAQLRIPAFVPVIPEELRQLMIEEAHNSLSSGHPGIKGTYQLLQSRCYWPGLHEDVEEFVKRCHACQINRSSPSHHIPLLPLPIAPHPFHTVGMDFLKLPKTSSGYQYLLVFTDYLTRWVEAVPTEKQDGATVAQALMDVVVSRHGLPKVLLSDQGKAFCEGVAAELYKKLDVQKKNTTPYHPQCNGLTERFNRTCIEMLSRWQVTMQDTEWDKHLPSLLWAYRCHYHRDFRASPFFMLYGRECNVPLAASVDFIDPRNEIFRSRYDYVKTLMKKLPEVWKFATECLQSIADRYKKINEKADSNYVPFPVGSAVYVRILDSRKIEKGKSLWSGPFLVRRIPSPVNYELSPPDDPNATFLIWAGHCRAAVDVNERMKDSQKEEEKYSSPSSTSPSSPTKVLLPFDPDDLTPS